MTKKAWQGRFSRDEHPLMERFNASIPFDKKLYLFDIQGSLAHAEMLREQKIISEEECEKICDGLEEVLQEIEKGDFEFQLSQEDIHMAIEGRLKEKIGEAAGKLHSARSRNDQVALDTRLYVIAKTTEVCQALFELKKNLLDLAQKNKARFLPGYTHLQRAQPISLAHHLLAYFEMFERDFSRFSDNLDRLDYCPLGAGALAGTTLKIDRELTAAGLGFSEPTRNSLDTVSDRDFVLDFLSSASTLMMHLSRLSEEWVLWSSQEFGFIKLPQEFCTGSSMMPQKINPDAPELIRGKTGRVFGNLVSVLTTLKALPLAYNKDMQEDKEPLFDSAETLLLCLEVLNAMLPNVEFDEERMKNALKEGFVLATDVADYLVEKGLPFRDAHAVVGALVQKAISEQKGLEDLAFEDFQKESELFLEDVFEILTIESSVNRRQSLGGTALDQVEKQLQHAQETLKTREEFFS